MGTRGLRVVRFRKRYYIFYNHWDSYPEGLGTEIAAGIPSDAAKYQEWLAAQRKSAEEWEAVCEGFLSVQPGSMKTTDLPEFMHRNFPSSLTPLNDMYIEWVYTMDLDRETFTVNNGAHFKLEQVPHIDWIKALENGRLGDPIALPAALPRDGITSLVAEHPPQSSDLLEALSDITLSDVCSSVRY